MVLSPTVPYRRTKKMRCDGDNHRAAPLHDASSMHHPYSPASTLPKTLVLWFRTHRILHMIRSESAWVFSYWLGSQKKCGGWRTNSQGGQGSVRAARNRDPLWCIFKVRSATRGSRRGPDLCAYVATTSTSLY